MRDLVRPWGARGKASIVLFGVLFALVLLAPAARGTYNPLGSGSTRLALDKGFLSLLKQNGVKLSVTGGAHLRGRTVIFPVVGGKLDPTNGRGTIENEGTLSFQAGHRRLPLGALQLKTTQRHAPYSVKVGGGQLKLARTEKLKVSRRGFNGEITVGGMRLSAKVATRLAKKLHLRGVFKSGQLLGSSVTAVIPETVGLEESGSVDLDLTPAFAAKLQSLFVAVNPIFPAEHPGPFVLPIFGGTLATDSSIGRVDTQGSLEFLQLGGGQVFWRESRLDFAGASISAEAEVDPSPPFGGKLGSLSIAGLAGGSVSADSRERTISSTGVAVTLDASMAAVFDEVFARPQGQDNVFLAGEEIATLNFSAAAE